MISVLSFGVCVSLFTEGARRSQIESGRSDPVALEFGESGGGVTVVAVVLLAVGVVVICIFLMIQLSI